MKLYQLAARGRDNLTGERKSICSKRVFYSKERAWEYGREEFLNMVSTPRDEYDMQILDIAEPITMHILELVLDEEV